MIKMAPFEALYGRKCRSPIHCYEIGIKQIETIDFIKKTIEDVKLIQQRIETAFSRQKSYADKHR